jgi:hypothetical protein
VSIAAYQNLRDTLEDLFALLVDLMMETAVENLFIRAGSERSRQAIYATISGPGCGTFTRPRVPMLDADCLMATHRDIAT